MYVSQPGIKPGVVEERAYQTNISEIARDQSTLVVLPTGMGKTIIALRVVAHVLKKRKGKVLFMAPTKPLVEQHAKFMREFLDDHGIINVFTGEVSPAKRKEMWDESTIICSTPQVIVNDLISARISLNEVNLLVVDEAHRTTGDYAYVFVGERYQMKQGGLILATTASPGSDISKILEVCTNLGIEQVEIRSKYDADVLNYVHGVDLKWEDMELPPEFKEIVGLLKDVLASLVKELKRFGVHIPMPVSTKVLLAAGNEIRGQIKANPNNSSLYQAAVVQAAGVKINHAIELAETQGMGALKKYLEKMIEESGSKRGSKASRMLANSPKITYVLGKLVAKEYEHPKIPKVLEIVQKELDDNDDARIIVFAHYRETAETLSKRLDSLPKARPVRFVGQASKGTDKGLRQKEQVATIERFREGLYNVLVATSVAEEGLDIPSTDLVVFYEPVPSEIRTIQRRGRTGRKRRGRVIILKAKGTRDQGYYYSSLKKEKHMHEELQRLKRDLAKKLSVGDIYLKRVEGVVIEQEDNTSKNSTTNDLDSSVTQEKEEGQTTLGAFKAPKPKDEQGVVDYSTEETERMSITVDSREFSSSVVKELARKGLVVIPKQLEVGDYVLSATMAIERKEVDDFLSSLMDGRLFPQLSSLSSAYMEPMVIIEGEGLVERKNISPKAIYGALASISADFRIPVFQTRDAKETADLLFALVSRRKSKGHGKAPARRHGKPGASSILDSQLFIIEGLPGISSVAAGRLLDHFGSVDAIFRASVEELQEVKGIGSKTAGDIAKIIRYSNINTRK